MSTNSIQATTSVANWNRATRHVEANMRSGRYVNAETTLIVAGPPRIADLGSYGVNLALGSDNSSNFTPGTGGTEGRDGLYPIGLVESFSLQQAQSVQKVFEIGSRRSYQAGGRVQVVGSLGRVQFNGASLLRVLYAYYPNLINLANGKVLGTGGTQDSIVKTIAGAGSGLTNIFPPIFFEPGSASAADPESADGVTPNMFFVNLMSELYSHPFGLGVIIRDNANKNYGAMYLEDCFITSHSFGVNGASTLITEAITLQCDAAVPLEFSTDAGAQIEQLLPN